MRLSCTDTEIWGFKNLGVTSLTFWGHVTSSVTWPLDSTYAVSYWWSIVTMHLSCTVTEIWLQSSSYHVKTPYMMQKSCGYLLHKPSCSQFCPKFPCHGNQGGSGIKLNDTIRLAVPENHTIDQLRLYLIHSQSYDRLKNCLIFPIGSIVFFSNFSNKYVKY